VALIAVHVLGRTEYLIFTVAFFFISCTTGLAAVALYRKLRAESPSDSRIDLTPGTSWPS